jgi:hypothetical protein
MNHQVYHDNLKLQVELICGNKYSELLATYFGWSRNYSIKMFMTLWTYSCCVMENERKRNWMAQKAYTGGVFKAKAEEAGVFCKLTDTNRLWQNRAEGEFGEVKIEAGHWMVKDRI